MILSLLKYYFSVIFSLFSIIGITQNLVYNGSFEIRDSVYDSNYNYWSNCPFSDNGVDDIQLTKARNWSNPPGKYPCPTFEYRGTSDYFHYCSCDENQVPSWISQTCIVGVPKSDWFRNYQLPRTGLGYCGGIMGGLVGSLCDIMPSEYIQSKLKNLLIKDSLYRITIYTSKSNGCSYSVSSIGALLSNKRIGYDSILFGLKDSIIQAQLINLTGYITDTLEWVKIDTVYTATGNENYITVGNYDVRKGQTRYEYPSPYSSEAMYLIDDISIYPINAPIDSARCGNDTTICLGNSLRLGKSNVKQDFKSEYSFEWYIQGVEDSVFYSEEHPIVSPDSSTTYIVKVIDFKFDKSTDSVRITVLDCGEPTNLVVYPNPTYDIVKFRFNSPIPENMSIEIYDVTGRLLKRDFFTQNYESKEVQIELFPFAVGMYIYSVVIDGERKFNGKLIKVK